MRVKNYLAPTMKGALLKVKQDLGPEAVILQTKKVVRGGFLGCFGRVCVQVTAAIDRKDPVKTFRTPAPPVSRPSALPPDEEWEQFRRDLREVKAAMENLTVMLGTIFNVSAPAGKFPLDVAGARKAPGNGKVTGREKSAEVNAYYQDREMMRHGG